MKEKNKNLLTKIEFFVLLKKVEKLDKNQASMSSVLLGISEKLESLLDNFSDVLPPEDIDEVNIEENEY